MKLIFLLIPFFLFSQNNYQVKYKMVTLFDGEKNYEATLNFSNLKSCFTYKLAAKDTATIVKEDIHGNREYNTPLKSIQKIYLDVITKKSYEKIFFPSGILVQDSLHVPNWTILEEKKMISNLLCRKAKTTFKGRNYEVWFTSEYPTTFGPWKLNGLPGLIIVAEDERREVYFEAISIIKINDAIEVPNNSKHRVISLKQYQLETEKKQREIEEQFKSMGDRDTKFEIKFGKAIGIEITD